MPQPRKSRRDAARRAVAEATSLEEARGATELPRQRGGGRATDPLTGELRRRDVLPLLVLHLISDGPSYGNQLMERISGMTEGVLSVNPNTMYPLLRQLEERGLIEGKWEHPERRSRRYYSLTAVAITRSSPRPEGRKEFRRLREDVRHPRTCRYCRYRLRPRSAPSLV